MSKEQNKQYDYYTPGMSIIRRIDQQTNKVEIFASFKGEWRESVAMPTHIRKHDKKLSPAAAMEIMAAAIITHS